MYDMILPGDDAEIEAIRERLHCDHETAILTIFERRNRLISTCLRDTNTDVGSDLLQSIMLRQRRNSAIHHSNAAVGDGGGGSNAFSTSWSRVGDCPES